MNSNAFFNRVEILLYSTLISAMSGINKLRTHVQHLFIIPIQNSPDLQANPTQLNNQFQEKSQLVSWKSIKQAFLTLCLWVILGFAAGFLIGMIKPW
jgi:hypothetical protein